MDRKTTCKGWVFAFACVVLAAIVVLQLLREQSSVVASTSSSATSIVKLRHQKHHLSNHSSSISPVYVSRSDDSVAGEVGRDEENQRQIDEEKHRLASQALEFVMSRRAAFEEVGLATTWKFRGIGYLYTRHDVILAGAIVVNNDQSRHSVHIYNVHPKNSPKEAIVPRNDCDKFTIWVRVFGKEIFSGSAQAVEATSSDSCYWKFDFEPTLSSSPSGEYYAVDAKPLMWNGKDRDYIKEQSCKSWETGNATEHEWTMNNTIAEMKHYGFKGFKFYGPQFSCCEVCNRLSPYCLMWVSPPWKLKEPSFANTGCELFFAPDTPEDFIPKSWILGDINVTIKLTNRRHRRLHEPFHGRPHGGEPQHFVGCGWSLWFTLDFPCLSGELDDKVFFLNDTFHVSPTKHVDDVRGTAVEVEPLPLCTPEVEFIGRPHGRWVQEPWPASTNSSINGGNTSSDFCPPFELEQSPHKKFEIVAYDGENPRCWHRDDLTVIGNRCVEMNCRFIHPRAIWNSRARSIDHWFGVWRESTCDYVEFTDEELQQCVTTKKIRQFRVDGRSIAAFLEQYLLQRVARLQLYNASVGGGAGLKVVLSTASLLHRTTLTERGLKAILQKVTPATPNRRIFFVSGLYLASEREVYTHVDRMLQLSRLAEKLLVPSPSNDYKKSKGYEMLNMFDMSAAFAYDTATQRDGMHIIGPPMKMAITKMFHYLCNDVVQGTRV